MITDALIRSTLRQTICDLVCCSTPPKQREEREADYQELLREADRRNTFDTQAYHGFWDYYSQHKTEIIHTGERE